MFTDDFTKTFRKYGEDRTPSGRPRYKFYFGRNKSATKWTLYKFKTYNVASDPPECVAIAYTLKNFVKVAKELGLHISKAERDELALLPIEMIVED